MNKKLAYLSLDPHIRRLRYGGYYRLDKDATKWKIVFHTIYMRLSLGFMLLYVLQQLIYIYQSRNNINKVIDTLFLCLSYSDSIYKQIVFWKKADTIEKLLDITKGPIFNQRSTAHDNILSELSRFTKMFLRIFNCAALSTCVLWTIYPINLFMQHKPVEFTLWLPFDCTKNLNFYMTIVFVWIATSWLGMFNTTMDAFVYSVLLQCKAQLSILRLDLKNLVLQSKEDATTLSKPYTEMLQQRFNKILEHYSEIVNFFYIIQKVFGGALMYQYLVSVWIICTTAYRIVNINPASVEFFSMIMYMGCVVSEILFFCYFGHEVTWESACVMDSAYELNWLEMPVSIRKSLILFMERIKRPLLPMAGNFVPLSNSSFLSLMRSSYSFYVFLKNTN